MRELTGGTKIRLSQIKGLNEWGERLALDKEDANGMEHSDNNGRFVSKNGGNDSEKKNDKKKGVAARLRDEFKNNTNKYLGDDFENKTSGIKAKFSKESQNEIASRVANSKANGFTIQEHFEVANQIKDLFEGATLENEHPDTKHGHKDVRIERFLSRPIKLKNGKEVQACITVKHSLDKDGRNIYSLETMDIKNALAKTRAKGQPNVSDCPLDHRIPHVYEKVKKNQTKDSLLGIWAMLKGVEP